MVGTSKILTVSYGTFSCTLEGFDDSFNTMKAIAEYFRDLASDDRYFGAEPPTPDAEMLAKIAEREISRRVDATMDDDGIVLRAAALTDQSLDAPAKVHDEASRAKVEADRKAAKAARKAEKAAQKAQRKAEQKAAKQAEKAKAKAEARQKAEEEAKAAEDARDEAADASEAAHTESDNDATADVAEGTTESDVEETRDDAPSSMLAAEDSAPENTSLAEAPAHPDDDSVAAKLQRIRAVVDTSATDEDSPSDDLTEQFLPQSDAPDVADVDTDDTDLVADFEAHEAELEEEAANDAVDTQEQDGDDMMSRVISQSAEDQAENDADVAPEQPRARVVRMKRADFEKAMAEQAEAEAEGEAETQQPETDDAPETGPDFGLLDGADELDDYLEDSDFTDDFSVMDDPDMAENLQAIQEDPVDADETADAVANALADQDETPEAAEDGEDAPQDDAVDFMADEPQVDDEALDRLMNETDAQMQEPEGSRRRDAIAQLKAAVAAKEAARQVGEPEDDGQDVENAFRNDLSEAVGPDTGVAPRPRPVVRSGARTERPRPAPLKLVAAQRIDVEDAEPRRNTPVVPRRVAARKDEGGEKRGAGSFAEFADNMGATELSDLLEAAAAYTAFVEGADEFSRPQILRRVRAVASDDFKREDELRSFAELISAGRFTKVRNGRFQVADDSRFNPERRAS